MYLAVQTIEKILAHPIHSNLFMYLAVQTFKKNFHLQEKKLYEQYNFDQIYKKYEQIIVNHKSSKKNVLILIIK